MLKKGLRALHPIEKSNVLKHYHVDKIKFTYVSVLCIVWVVPFLKELYHVP